jgi:hypothetical protein
MKPYGPLMKRCVAGLPELKGVARPPAAAAPPPW